VEFPWILNKFENYLNPRTTLINPFVHKYSHFFIVSSFLLIVEKYDY